MKKKYYISSNGDTLTIQNNGLFSAHGSVQDMNAGGSDTVHNAVNDNVPNLYRRAA